MKLMLILFTLLTPCCSVDEKQDLGQGEADESMQVILFEKGKEVSRRSIEPDGQLGKDLKSWLTSVILENEDENSYAPSVILLGKKLKVNFQKGKTIISVKPNDDPKALWQQYSRNPNMQDRKTRSLLKKVGK